MNLSRRALSRLAWCLSIALAVLCDAGVTLLLRYFPAVEASLGSVMIGLLGHTAGAIVEKMFPEIVAFLCGISWRLTAGAVLGALSSIVGAAAWFALTSRYFLAGGVVAYGVLWVTTWNLHATMTYALIAEAVWLLVVLVQLLAMYGLQQFFGSEFVKGYAEALGVPKEYLE